MIRIATAHSKIRLSKAVTTKDIDIAMNLLHLSIFGCHLDEEEQDDDMVDDNTPLQDRKNLDKNGHSKSRMEIDQGNDSRAKKNVKFDQEDDFKANGVSSQSRTGRIVTRRQTGPKPPAEPMEEVEQT